MAWSPYTGVGGGKWSGLTFISRRRTAKATAAAQAARPGATLTATLDELGISAQGILVVASPIAFGTLDANLGVLASSGLGGVIMSGTGSITLGGLSSTGSARLSITATAAKTLGAASVVSTATLRLAGSASITLGAVTLVTSGTSITAPVLTKTSSAGAAPFLFTASLNTSDTFAGYTFRVQVAANTSSDFTSVTQDISHTLTESDITSGDIDITSDGFLTPSGAMSLRVRIERDDGIVSPWSNVLTDTISAATTLLTATNGFDKGPNLTISGSPALTMTGLAARGAYEYVRATASSSLTKWWVEFTVNTIGGGLRIGLDNGTKDFTAYFGGFPSGVADNNGWYYNIAGNSDFWTNSGSSPSASNATSWASGNVGRIEVDETTKAVRLYKNNVLVSTNSYNATTLASGKILVGCADAESVTFNFGQSASAGTPTAGFDPHG